MYGITATVGEGPPGADSRHQPGAHRPTPPEQRVNVMELLVVLLFFVLIALASALGLTADSRDSADWKPSHAGARESRWH